MSASPAFRIGPAGVESLPAIETVIRAAFDPRYGEAWTKAQCLSVLAMPGYRLNGAWAASRGGEPEALAGFSIVRTVVDESELLLIGVDPTVRGQGLASLLMDEWIAHARAHSVKRLFLEMRRDNPARALYEKFAFCDVAVRKSYYRGNDGVMRDAVTMDRKVDI